MDCGGLEGSASRLLRKSDVFRKICRDAARASTQYGMLGEGDRVLVGVSGGEDSLTLMHVLDELRRRSPFRFDVIPATIDLRFATFRLDALREYCSRQGWVLECGILDGAQLLADKGAEERPCALCSRLRRGQLHAMADRLGCNKIALGQQLDDLCVSLLLALFRGGGLKTMGPNVPADSGSKRLIRPLCLVAKSRIHQVAELLGYPPVKSCPYEEQLKADGDRYFLEKLLEELEPRFRDIKSAMLHGMSDVRLAHLLDSRYLPREDKGDPDAGKL